MINILDYSLFDDGSIECRTFMVCTESDAYHCEYGHILARFSEAIDAIISAIEEGQRYITLTDGTEISWD